MGVSTYDTLGQGAIGATLISGVRNAEFDMAETLRGMAETLRGMAETLICRMGGEILAREGSGSKRGDSFADSVLGQFG